MGKAGSDMFLEPFLESPCQFIYALLLTTHLVTLEPVDNSTFLSGLISVFGCHKEVLDGIASFKICRDPDLATYILEAFAKSLGVWDHHVDFPFIFVTIVVSLMYAVIVLGLITTVSIVAIGLEFV